MSRVARLRVALPDWANWIAQDEDGRWFVYDQEPVLWGKHCWGPRSQPGRRWDYLCKGPEKNQWKFSLRRV